MITRSVRLICLAAVMAATLLAQDPYGRITGRVVDGSGAAVPGAAVRVTNTESNVAVNTFTDSQGNYEGRSLIPGHYEITAEKTGFKRYVRGPIEVRVGDVLTVDIGMELGVASESIT